MSSTTHHLKNCRCKKCKKLKKVSKIKALEGAKQGEKIGAKIDKLKKIALFFKKNKKIVANHKKIKYYHIRYKTSIKIGTKKGVKMLEPKKSGRPSKKPSMAELDMLYKNMTVRELAKHYEVSETTIKRWIIAYRKELKEKKGEI